MRRRIVTAGTWLALVLVVLVSSAWAGEPPTTPFLRIETGMHTARIQEVGVDAAERFLVTGSIDKTVRVWELETGKLLRIIRPPMAQGNEGQIYAVAMSPDGQTIAAGGSTGFDWEGSSCIYIFDRVTGDMAHRRCGMPSVHALGFSRNGDYLAVGQCCKDGLIVFRTDNYEVVAEDDGYDGSIMSLDWDREGRLVTVADDGTIRLYDASLERIQEVKVPDGQKPWRGAFSPDGSKIAVGFDDDRRVIVLDGRTLDELYRPDVAGVDKGDFSVVAWSADGQTLYAAGDYWKGGTRRIRAWRDGGKGRFVDLEGTERSIGDLRPLANGKLIVVSGGPAIWMLDAKGKRTVFQSAPIADFNAGEEKFLVSPDGTVVQFGYETFGESPARFSIATRSLTLHPSRHTRMAVPLIETPGLRLTDWIESYHPKLNGVPLPLKRDEFSRSLAIGPDGQRLVLGTDWYVRCFDRSGQELWKTEAPDTTWAVNVAKNGKVVVAAHGNGVIRWYRMSDGAKLLTLFPHKDKKRWVLWTPSGYYDASPGGESLVGWRVNRGAEASGDFFPVGQFRATYYRPDVVSRVLALLDVDEALRIADEESGRQAPQGVLTQRLPPVLTILSPHDGDAVSESRVLVRVGVRVPADAPVTRVWPLVDGRPVSDTKGVQVEAGTRADERTITVPMPQRDATITVLAENRHGVSEGVTVQVRWAGRPPAKEFVIKPKLYALAVGVSRYANAKLRLQFAAKDAEDVVRAIGRQRGELYDDVEIKVLTDQGATKDRIVEGLHWLESQVTQHDVALIYLSGHGVTDLKGRYYYLPYQADLDQLRSSGVMFSEIVTTVQGLAGKVLVFLDTCRSGNILAGRKGSRDVTGIINELASAGTGAVVFAASPGDEDSLEDPAWQNGAFTKALVEALERGTGYESEQVTTVNMLDLYIAKRVKELTKGQQRPTTAKPQMVPDFPVAMQR